MPILNEGSLQTLNALGSNAFNRTKKPMIELCGDLLPKVFGHDLRRLLLVLHAAGSTVLIGSATHHALLMRHYLRGHLGRSALEKTYARVLSISYIATFIIGALLYPSYRVHVRGLYLDRFHPFYARLFDVKEVFAALALLLAIGLGLVSLTFKPAEEKWLLPAYAVSSFLVCAVVWMNAIAGLLITSLRGIG